MRLEGPEQILMCFPLSLSSRRTSLCVCVRYIVHIPARGWLQSPQWKFCSLRGSARLARTDTAFAASRALRSRTIAENPGACFRLGRRERPRRPTRRELRAPRADREHMMSPLGGWWRWGAPKKALTTQPVDR
jgi:hypothetical protein